MKDRNGKEVKIGDRVRVAPVGDFMEGFSGYATKTLGAQLFVQDENGDTWTNAAWCKPSQIELISEATR